MTAGQPAPGAGALTDSGAPAASPGGLRKNYLSGLENVAQTLGVLAPTGTLGVIIPLLIGKTGNATWLLFLAVLGICLLILVNINVFATRCVSAGGLATYARLGLGRRAGLATGWIYIGAMVFGVASAAPAAAYYAALVVSQMTGVAPTPLLGGLLTALVVVGAAWAAFKDIKLSSDIMIVIEITSLAVMAIIVAVAMIRGGTWVDRPQLTLQGLGPRSFSAGLVLAFLTMGGFESATTLGEEARHAKTVIPRAILGCVVPVGLLYLGITYFLVGLGRKFGLALDQLEAPFDTLARANHLGLLGTLSSLGVALSYFACTLGSINAGSRILYSLAEEKLFFPAFGRAHPVNATPHRAIALVAVIGIATPAGLLAAGTSLVSVIDYVSQIAALGFIGSYFMVCLAAPFFLRALPGRRRGGVAVSVAALLLLAGVMVQSVFPIPPAPACFFPYVFVAAAAAGFATSLWVARRREAVGAR
jgi:amino acid transporter